MKKHVLSGVLILALGFVFYLHNYQNLIIKLSQEIVSSPAGAGSFMNLLSYEFATIAYLPFAFMGFFYLIKSKQYHFPLYWFLACALIVALRLIFFNRFVIFLDIGFLILAGFAFSVLLLEKKTLSVILLCAVLLAMAVNLTPLIGEGKPHISDTEKEFIKSLSEVTEENSVIFSNMGADAPLLQAYSSRKVIGPGLFSGEGIWTHAEWRTYWTAGNFSSVSNLMNRFDRPLYIYLGEKSKRGNMDKFESCVTSVVKKKEWSC